MIEYKTKADDLDLKTKIGFELKPFIVAYANLGEWEHARDLTLLAYENDVTTKPLYCALWIDLLDTLPATETRDNSFTNVMDTLRCNQP